MTDLTTKFSGPEGREALVRTLRMADLVQDSTPLAEDIAARAEIVPWPVDATLIIQGENDDDMHFILAGRLQVLVGNQEVALLGAGHHVGELALIDPRAVRSASVRALHDTVTAKVTEEDFVELGRRHPFLWRRLSQVLGDRLRQESRYVRLPNPRPRVVVTSSRAGLALAQALQSRLEAADLVAGLWIAEPDLMDGRVPVQALEDAFGNADFGVIAIAPGDSESAGDPRSIAPRECLFLQGGVCLGALGPSRTFLVEPAGLDPPFPTGVLGIPAFNYTMHPEDAIAASLDQLCQSLRQSVEKLGPR